MFYAEEGRRRENGGRALILTPSQTRRGKTYATSSIMHVEPLNFYRLFKTVCSVLGPKISLIRPLVCELLNRKVSVTLFSCFVTLFGPLLCFDPSIRRNLRLLYDNLYYKFFFTGRPEGRINIPTEKLFINHTFMHF